MNYFEFQKKFPTEKSVIKYWIKIRYKDGIKCNHCGSDRVSVRRDQPKVCQCNSCNNSFSIFKDTIFEDSCTDLRKWMYAIHLFLNGKKGISGYQLQREIGVTYKTAWRMLKQIRTAMGNQDNQEFINTIIEIDETYVGGKPRPENNHDDDNNNSGSTGNKRGRGTNKTPVVGVVDRNNKKIHAKVALPNEKGQKLTGKQLMNILDEVCKTKNFIMTDEFGGYNALNRTNHIHFTIDHKQAYADGFIHTNNVESFWATLKRGILGIYHHVSADYLQNYVNEFCFRYNNRKYPNKANPAMFDIVLRQAILV